MEPIYLFISEKFSISQIRVSLQSLLQGENNVVTLIALIKKVQDCPCGQPVVVTHVLMTFHMREGNECWLKDAELMNSTHRFYYITIFFISLCSVDLLAGFNGQEGGLYLTGNILGIQIQTHKIVTGFTVEMAQLTLAPFCQLYTPMSVGLCVEFIMDTYGITTAPDDQERGTRISYAFGKINQFD